MIEWLVTSCNAVLIFLGWEEGHVLHLYCVFCSANSNTQVHIISPHVNIAKSKYIISRRNTGHVLTVLPDRGGSWTQMLEAQWCCSCSDHCGNKWSIRNTVKSLASLTRLVLNAFTLQNLFCTLALILYNSWIIWPFKLLYCFDCEALPELK